MNISPSHSLHPIPIQSKIGFAHLHICTILIQSRTIFISMFEGPYHYEPSNKTNLIN